jgi:4'-phosphopantetheinyl transferase EntD/rubredoxin
MCEGLAKRRRIDFVNGRACAQLALRHLGYNVPSLRRGAYRQPLWPKEVAGSITHTEGYCVAMAVTRERTSSVGIDAESTTHVSDRLILRSCTPAELAGLPQSGPARIAAAICLLSAKESLFKCLFPLLGPIGLRDADIRAESDGRLYVSAFHRPLLRALAPLLQGRCARMGGLTLSYFVVAAWAGGEHPIGLRRQHPMKKWQCNICGWVYDEALGMPQDGISAGTAWSDIPDDWTCPECGVSKSDFDMAEVLEY